MRNSTGCLHPIRSNFLDILQQDAKGAALLPSGGAVVSFPVKRKSFQLKDEQNASIWFFTSRPARMSQATRHSSPQQNLTC